VRGAQGAGVGSREQDIWLQGPTVTDFLDCLTRAWTTTRWPSSWRCSASRATRCASNSCTLASSSSVEPSHAGPSCVNPLRGDSASIPRTGSTSTVAASALEHLVLARAFRHVRSAPARSTGASAPHRKHTDFLRDLGRLFHGAALGARARFAHRRPLLPTRPTSHLATSLQIARHSAHAHKYSDAQHVFRGHPAGTPPHRHPAPDGASPPPCKPGGGA